MSCLLFVFCIIVHWHLPINLTISPLALPLPYHTSFALQTVMASLSHHYTYPMRPSNKEPQWTTVYDDLFNQYIDTDGFEFGACNTTTSSSDETNNEAIESIEGLTDSGESSSPGARRLSDDFWAKTLQALEESASSLEQSQQRERQTPAALYTKSHPHSDFLSLGGFPSPHISSLPSPSDAARRRKAARYQTERSAKTPERPIGITKAYRAASKSSRMMSPSRYRAGAQEAWIENLHRTPNMIMNLPVRSMPLTPPSSGRNKQASMYAGYCSPRDIDVAPFQPFTQYGEPASPFSNNFQQSPPAPIYSPDIGFNGGNMEPTVFREIYYEPADQNNKSAWSANSFAAEDIYEPSPTFSPWMASEKREARYQASLSQAITNMPPSHNDPTLAPSYTDEMNSQMDAIAEPTPYYITADLPRTPSPSPPRRRHQRTPSSKTTSRKSSGQQLRSRSSKTGFVNYTPSDSEKLLTGVAPSGSSKTKARREREAAEKWRRFSQAAVEAVAKASGDITKELPVVGSAVAPADMVDTSAGGS